MFQYECVEYLNSDVEEVCEDSDEEMVNNNDVLNRTTENGGSASEHFQNTPSLIRKRRLAKPKANLGLVELQKEVLKTKVELNKTKMEYYRQKLQRLNNTAN